MTRLQQIATYPLVKQGFEMEAPEGKNLIMVKWHKFAGRWQIARRVAINAIGTTWHVFDPSIRDTFYH